MPCFLAAPHTPSSTTSASTAACSFAVYRRLFLAAIFYSSHPNRLRTVRNFRLWNGWSDGRQEQIAGTSMPFDDAIVHLLEVAAIGKAEGELVALADVHHNPIARYRECEFGVIIRDGIPMTEVRQTKERQSPT